MLIDDLKGKKIGVCVSGGLDSKTVTSRLMKEGLTFFVSQLTLVSRTKKISMISRTRWRQPVPKRSLLI